MRPVRQREARREHTAERRPRRTSAGQVEASGRAGTPCAGEAQLGLPGQSWPVWERCRLDTKGVQGTWPQTQRSSSAAQPPPAPRTPASCWLYLQLSPGSTQPRHLTPKPQLQSGGGGGGSPGPAQAPTPPDEAALPTWACRGRSPAPPNAGSRTPASPQHPLPKHSAWAQPLPRGARHVTCLCLARHL